MVCVHCMCQPDVELRTARRFVSIRSLIFHLDSSCFVRVCSVYLLYDCEGFAACIRLSEVVGPSDAKKAPTNCNVRIATSKGRYRVGI
jgi:hypothetical protein